MRSGECGQRHLEARQMASAFASSSTGGNRPFVAKQIGDDATERFALALTAEVGMIQHVMRHTRKRLKRSDEVTACQHRLRRRNVALPLPLRAAGRRSGEKQIAVR